MHKRQQWSSCHNSHQHHCCNKVQLWVAITCFHKQAVGALFTGLDFMLYTYSTTTFWPLVQCSPHLLAFLVSLEIPARHEQKPDNSPVRPCTCEKQNINICNKHIQEVLLLLDPGKETQKKEHLSHRRHLVSFPYAYVALNENSFHLQQDLEVQESQEVPAVKIRENQDIVNYFL